MKFQLQPTWFWFIIIALVIFVLYIIIAYFNKEHSFSDLKDFLMVLVVVVAIILVLFIFASGYILIFIVSGAEEDGTLIFTLLNGFLIGAYLLILGFVPKLDNNQNYLKILVLIGFVIFSLQGFGYIGIRIEFTDVKVVLHEFLPFNSLSDLLVYDIYQSNSYHGGSFFLLNPHIFFTIFVTSFLTEAEVA